MAWGGGIFSYHSLSLLRCTISGNKTTSVGGGVYISNLGTLSASNCTISSNLAGSGGGIHNLSKATLTNCTITSNTATTSGGGISGAFDIRSSIIAGNNSTTGSDISGSLVSGDFNLIQNTDGCTITGATAHNIYNQDPLLGPLANNGGPTPTHALRFNSPAVDAGISGGLSTDQRGFTRPIDCSDVANAEGGDGSDIGAYELNPSAQMSIYTAVEVEFGTTLGRSYRVESSTDMVTWSQVEAGIAGTGGSLTRLYTTRVSPKLFFRAVQE